jgi:hypothetical protein
MRRIPLLVLVLAAVLQLSASSAAPPPPGAISSNVEFIANIPEMRTAISVNFMGNTMFVSTQTGLYAYSIANLPAAPTPIGALPMHIWQNEDLDISPERGLAIISRDPRQVSVAPSGALPYGAIHIVDISIPHAMTVVGTFPIPAGHTSTCINDCTFLWTGGPLANAQVQPAGWTGRPIYATDITDPTNPVQCPEPIDIGRDDGTTAYSHDVQVDEMGIAWVSGEGGVRGYWTEGQHVNPLTGEAETATGCDPIPYAGGGTPEEATPSEFMHNAWRDLDATIPGEDDPETPGDDTKGHVLYATEEEVVSACGTSGRFATYDLRGSYDGEGWKHDPDDPFRMRVLDTWWPEGQAGSTGCASAHYFEDRGDGILAYGFYGQGTRFLDVSNPKDIRQIGYYRPNGGNVWGASWHTVREGEEDQETYVFVADNARGIDILKFGGSPGDPLPPPPGPGATESSKMSPLFGNMCVAKASDLTVA